MRLAFQEVARLIAVDARHRSGIRMRGTLDRTILDHAQAELHELMDDPDDPEELADLLGCLIHYAVKRGWTEEYLELLMLDKFKIRFTEPAQPRLTPLKKLSPVHVADKFTTFTEKAIRDAAPKLVGKAVTDGLGGPEIGTVESTEVRGLEIHGVLLMKDGTRQTARLL